jgi:hypothetical protein
MDLSMVSFLKLLLTALAIVMSFENTIPPPLVKVKRAFDRIFQGVNSREDSNLSENQPWSEPFNLYMYIPSESQANRLNNDAASASENAAPVIKSENEEDSDRTPSPPPHPPKYDSLINQNIAQIVDQLDNEELHPSEPSQHKPQTPPSEHPILDSAVVVQPPSPTVNDVGKSPQHVDQDNTSTLATPMKQQLLQLHNDLDSEVTTPPTNLQEFMQNLSNDCIVIHPHLPSKITNEPLDHSQEDITQYLLAVDKNLRRMSTAIPGKVY